MNRFCAPARGPNVDRLPVQNPTKVEFVLNLRTQKHSILYCLPTR
jgi:hypothetical protein